MLPKANHVHELNSHCIECLADVADPRVREPLSLRLGIPWNLVVVMSISGTS